MKYITQQGTGAYSRFNCGAACAAMAANAYAGAEIPVAEIRQAVRSWTLWKPSHIIGYFESLGVPVKLLPYTSVAEMMADSKYEAERTVIININMQDIPRQKTKNKSYRTWLPRWGHFLVIASISECGNYAYCHDPYDAKRGEFRRYDVAILDAAIKKYSPYYIEVG